MSANVTHLERLVLVNIAENEYAPGNGMRPERADDATCWSDSIDCGPNTIAASSIPGVVSSLSKKGLVLAGGEGVTLTEAGFEAYNIIKDGPKAAETKKENPMSQTITPNSYENLTKKQMIEALSPALNHNKTFLRKFSREDLEAMWNEHASRDVEQPKPEKKTRKAAGWKSEVIEAIRQLPNQMSRKELLERAVGFGASESAAQTFLSDIKNPKYAPKGQLCRVDANGKYAPA